MTLTTGTVVTCRLSGTKWFPVAFPLSPPSVSRTSSVSPTDTPSPSNTHSPRAQPLAPPPTSCLCASDSSGDVLGGTTQHVSFRVWLMSLSVTFSGFIYIVAGVRKLSLRPNDGPLSGRTAFRARL